MIYAFDQDCMRPYYPLESDYAALVGHRRKYGPIATELELHGKFADEYAKLGTREKEEIFQEFVGRAKIAAIPNHI
jgi:hypothetical protein